MTDNIINIGVEAKKTPEDLLEISSNKMIEIVKNTGHPALILYQNGNHPNDINFASNSSDPRKIVYMLELAKSHIIENGYGDIED